MSAGFYYFYLIPAVFLLLFCLEFKYRRAWLITGFMLSAGLISFFVIFFIHGYESGSPVLRFIATIPLIFAVLLLTFGMYVFIALLILNTRSILKKEKRNLKHMLTFILAIGLLAVIFAPRFIDVSLFPTTLRYFSYSVYGLLIFYLLHLIQFIMSVFLCNLVKPKRNQDYIIVLGCWIKNGQVTPILARRIDKAIAFYNRQKEEGNKPPKLVLSGGLGPDETRSEAEAMQAYALGKGIPKEHLLLEPRSSNTAENMRFSKEIINADSENKSYNCIFATNNYHLLRANVFAGRAGLKIDGIGAKTAFYYLPNAILREYIAYIYIYFRLNIALGVSILIFGSFILPQIISNFT